MLFPFAHLMAEITELTRAIRSPPLLRKAMRPEGQLILVLVLGKALRLLAPHLGESVTAVPCCTGGKRGTRCPRLLQRDTAPDVAAGAAEGTPRTRRSSHCVNVRNALKIAQSTEQPVGNSLSQQNFGANEKPNN